MKKYFLLFTLLICIFNCTENSVESLYEKGLLKFTTDKVIYNLDDPWFAKIVNYSDSTVFVSACGRISFGILKQSETENKWKEIKSIIQPCLAIYSPYHKLLPKDTVLVSGSPPYIENIITESGRYKLFVGYSNSLNIELGDTLFSNIFEVKQ